MAAPAHAPRLPTAQAASVATEHLPARRLVLLLAAVACVAVVVSLPILRFPQLDADDYRYLHLVAELRAGRIGLLDASIIENRWDHLWWVGETGVVRFFRPTLMLSYLADSLVHTGSAAGLLRTNALLYLATCLLAAVLIARVVPRFLPALAGSLLFAGFACHAETIWYVAGRNETLLALGVLGALVCHTLGGRARLGALPCYAFALLSKELALPLPLLALVLDRFVARRADTLAGCLRRDRVLWLGHAALAAGYLLVRQVVLARAGGSDLVFPYFVSPARPEFAAHLWHQVRTYGENLLLAGITPPFLRPDQVAERTTVAGTVLTLLVPIALAVWLVRDRRAVFFALLAAATWLPATVVYVSERYLFLPSLGLAGVVAVAVARARAHPVALAAAVPLVFGWAAHQTAVLHSKNRRISQKTQNTIALHEKVAALRGKLAADRPIYVLGLPGDVFGAQFFADLVRVALGEPGRTCRVLTVLSEEARVLPATAIARAGPAALEVRGTPFLMLQSSWLFPWTSLAAGTRVDRDGLGFAVQVLEGSPARCEVARFELPHPIEAGIYLRFAPAPPRLGASLGDLIREGSLDVLRP